MTVSNILTFKNLTTKAEKGEIDTVLVCLVDMQGRLMGKRFHVSNFIASAYEETHCCNYLLATDLEMATPDGYQATSWTRGYGDYLMKPDLSTLRPVPWLDGTVMVLCDILDHHSHKPIAHAPRQILKEQIKRFESQNLTPMMATELEFFIFKKTLDEIRQEGYRNLETLGPYNEDYHILQTTKEEHVMRPLRNHLVAAGIPVECSKGEAEQGQQELNIKYAHAMLCADHHTIAKHATKEIAWQQGHSATFLPKWHHKKVGSASHIHMSLWKGDRNIFYDPKGEYGMSKTMKQFVAGLLAYASDCMFFFAPYINSYKRFAKGTFAPTKIAWSVDNRTAGFRLCGSGTKSIRIECRIPGADCNPYLAQSALLAAGLKGIEGNLELPHCANGDMYNNQDAAEFPNTLRSAIETLRHSKMLRKAMSDGVIDHYVRCAEWEQEEFDRVVTDWEIAREFEKA